MDWIQATEEMDDPLEGAVSVAEGNGGDANVGRLLDGLRGSKVALHCHPSWMTIHEGTISTS